MSSLSRVMKWRSADGRSPFARSLRISLRHKSCPSLGGAFLELSEARGAGGWSKEFFNNRLARVNFR